MSDSTKRTVEQTYIDATRDDRWWKYLVLPDYDVRERVGYTLSQVAYAASDQASRFGLWLEHAGHRLHGWAPSKEPPPKA